MALYADKSAGKDEVGAGISEGEGCIGGSRKFDEAREDEE